MSYNASRTLCVQHCICINFPFSKSSIYPAPNLQAPNYYFQHNRICLQPRFRTRNLICCHTHGARRRQSDPLHYSSVSAAARSGHSSAGQSEQWDASCLLADGTVTSPRRSKFPHCHNLERTIKQSQHTLLPVPCIACHAVSDFRLFLTLCPSI